MSNQNHDFYQEHLEWETLEIDEEITNLTFETEFYGLNKNCILKFSRDNQYKIQAIISGNLERINEVKLDVEYPKGTFVSGETIIGYSEDGYYKYKFLGVILKSYNIRNFAGLQAEIEAELKVDRIEKYIKNNDIYEIESIREWYLTGKVNINFPRPTSRSLTKSYQLLRDGITSPNESKLIKSRSRSRDYLLVKLPDTSFIVSSVPKKYDPNWAFKLSIEYKKSLGRIPTPREREAICELIGFIFGNQLLKIGQTSYDNSYSLISEEYKNPWGDNVINRCKREGLPPIKINSQLDWYKIENLLNKLVNDYLEYRELYNLKDVMWKYWLAKYSPIGTNLPILSSALETLTEKIHKNYSKIKNYYIEPKKYKKIISDELLSIEKKLINNPNKIKVLNKIENAIWLGSNEKIELMLEKIQLSVNKVERSAMKARNKMAHSSIGNMDDKEIEEIIRLTHAYETFFNRILLKILSYEGKYIDYYTLGHPERDIREPIPK